MVAVDVVALFDIDGTLIRAGDPAHRAAFDRALHDVYGVPATLDGLPLAGMLDRQIARAAADRAGVPAATVEQGLSAVMARMGELYADRVRTGDRQSHLLPGLPDAAQVLAAAGVGLAVVTGTARAVARAKLTAAGIDASFPVGAYGDEADHRGELVVLGHRRACRHFTTSAPPERCVVVGDTPRDVAAARHAGVRVVAVATGAVDRATLAASGPDLLLDDLGDPVAVLAAVRGDPDGSPRVRGQ